MPKLSHEVIEEKKGRIEEAAKQLFIKQGFHATSMRDIAARTGASLGNLYNYYCTKEEILESIIGKYQKVIDARLRAIFDEIEEPFEPESMTNFGRLVKEMVNDHHDFWLLMYIDVLEFENRHFRKMFEGLAQNLRRRFSGYFAELRRREALYDGIDPAVGFTAVYMQFFNYFLVEKLFGGNRHFGITDDQVIVKLTEIFRRGILKPDSKQLKAARRGRARQSRSRSQKKAD
ncbi:MAG: TetR/AcrR family transcriptional regulator [Pyrinomonadaceae bacterium]|nr:TetR/AcrR family transcriptional regulator [Pyrinomonadaceae bacterium]